VAITFGAYNNGVRTNSTIVDFGNSAGPTTVTHAAIFDAATGGNMLFSSPLVGGNQDISLNSSVTFPVGTVTRTVD
jgi:hypothetical protein